MSSIVGTKGQIVIEKTIRDALGLEAGYVAVQRLMGDHVEVRFYPPEHAQSLRGTLADYVTRSVPQEEWDAARAAAWDEAAREKTTEDTRDA